MRACMLLLAGLSGLPVLAGCGGSKGAAPVAATGGGRVVVTVQDAGGSRVIPPETRSIKVVATSLAPAPDPGEEPVLVGEAVAPRSEGQAATAVTIEPLPAIRILLTATAHASADGTGAALASGSTEVVVPTEGTVQAAITLQATDFPLPIIESTASATANAQTWPNDPTFFGVTEEGTFSASAQESGHVEIVSNDEVQAFSTLASARIDGPAQITVEGVNQGGGSVFYDDRIFIALPGLNVGVESEITLVYQLVSEFTGPPPSGEVSWSLGIRTDSGFDSPLVAGGYRDGALTSGTPPVNGEVRLRLGFRNLQDQRFLLQSGVFVHSRLGGNHRLRLSARLLRFEGVPEGTRVRLLSRNSLVGNP